LHGWEKPEQLADSVTLSTLVMSKMVGSGDFLKWTPKLLGWAVRYASQAKVVLSLANVNFSVCEKKHLYTDLTCD